MQKVNSIHDRKVGKIASLAVLLLAGTSMVYAAPAKSRIPKNAKSSGSSKVESKNKVAKGLQEGCRVCEACLGIIDGKNPGRKCISVTARTAKDKLRFDEFKKSIVAAQDLVNKGKFSEAVDALELFRAKLELDVNKFESVANRSMLDNIIKEVVKQRSAWAKDLLKRARLVYNEGKFNEASKIATEAGLIDPGSKLEANELVKLCVAQERVTNYEKTVSVNNFDSDVYAKKERIRKLLKEAQIYYNSRKYSEALSRVEQVFIENPYDVNAITFASKIYAAMYKYGADRRSADVQSILSHAEWQWAEPVFVLEPNEGDIKSEIKDNSQDIAMMNRMDKIIFPTFSFQDAEIGTVINFLSSRSKTYDPDKLGITINNVIPPQDSQNIRVSVNFSYLPMSAAIRYICQSTGLTYSVNNGSLTIGTKSVIDDMTTKFFHNPGNLINYITEEIGSTPGVGGIEQAKKQETTPQEPTSERKSSGGASGGSSESRGIGEGVEAIARTNAATVTSEQLMAYFSKRGIKFPEGSAISYQPAIRKIMSRNTPENQADLEQLLRQIDADVPLIMVEIKSVEIGESDYQELGFEWSLHNLSKNMTESGALGSESKTGWLFGQGVNAITGGALSALRGGTAGTVKDSTLVSNLNIFPALFGTRHPFGSDIPFNIGLTINAMSQNNRSETLNAPKLMTSSGSLASVDMVKEYYFPDSWEEMEVEIETSDNSSKVTITPPVPEFGDSTPIGIQFKVKPEMLNDRRTIRMTLTPKLTNFLRKDEWTLSVWGVDRQLDSGGKYIETEVTYSYKIWRPVISERTLNMVVDVYDGQTVVLGGMVQNETQSRIDKVPFFSELPFIGRFFQSHAENTVRNNLLIFVTARLVDNYGIPIRRNVDSSSPDFKR